MAIDEQSSQPHLRHSGHHHHSNFSGIPNTSSISIRSNLSVTSASPLFQMTTMNFSVLELEEMTSISNGTDLDLNSTISQNETSSLHTYLTGLYMKLIPVMLFFCTLTFLVNLLIVLSARWCRKPMSPTLYFSISLALADAYSSFVLGTGLIVNSLLPTIYGINWKNYCLQLTLEAFRQGGVLVTVSHLLALAINHWIGIVRPLHYAATMTRRTAWIVILLSWICPILMIFIYFFTVSGEGFLSDQCGRNNFLSMITYRAFFASCFFAPLFLMSLIYLHIFLIVRNHHSHRLRYQVKNNCQQLRRNVKAVVTTALILGTYILGWMPAIVYCIVVCDDCTIKLNEVPDHIRYPVGITINTLVILKALIDPIIYAARMSDIQAALRKMRYDFLKLFCAACAPELPVTEVNDRYDNMELIVRGLATGFSKFDRSFYETKSMRMSSGSSSSSRRLNTAIKINSSLNHQNHNAGNNEHSHNGNNSHPLHQISTNNSHCKLLENNFEMTEFNQK